MSIKASKYYDIIVLSLCFFMAIYLVVPAYLSVSVGLFYMSVERLAFLLLLGVWIFGILNTNGIVKHLMKRIKYNKTLIWLLVLFFMIQWISVFFSLDPDYSLKVLTKDTLFSLLLLVIVLSVPVKYKYYQYYGNTILYVSLCLILISIYELATGKLLFENLMRSSFDLTEYQQSSLTEKVRGDSRRLQATFNNPLIFGQYIIMVVPALWYFKSYIKQNWLVNTTIVLLFILSYFIKSRTLFVTSIFLIIYVIYYLSSKEKSNAYKKIVYSYITGVLILIGIYFLSFIQFENLFGGKGLTSSSRLTQLKLASELLSEWPLFGFGTGIGVQILDFGFGNGTIDNYFLTISLDSGFICLFLFISFIIVLIAKFSDLHTHNKILYASLLLFILYLFTLSVKQGHTLFYFLLGIFLNNYTDSKRGCWLIVK